MQIAFIQSVSEGQLHVEMHWLLVPLLEGGLDITEFIQSCPTSSFQTPVHL